MIFVLEIFPEKWERIWHLSLYNELWKKFGNISLAFEGLWNLV